MRKLLSGAGLALAAKIVTGFAIVAVAAAVAGAAAETAITGSANPDKWGQQVKAQVAKCKAELAADQHGIGACVSAFAKQHGELNSDEKSPTDTGKGHGNGNAFGHSDNKTKGHPGHQHDNTAEVDAED